MSKILSRTKSVGMNLTLLFCICLSLLPISVIAQPIDFYGKMIKKPVNVEFWKRYLQEGIEIDSSDRRHPRVIFRDPINFRQATFDSSVSFYNAEFHSTGDFGGTNFKDTADFHRAAFDASVSFAYAEFNSRVDFMHTKFNGIADFKGTVFQSSVSFRLTVFNATIDFAKTKFNGPADLGRTTFNGWANFGGTKFKARAIFSEATFGSNSSVSYAEFDSTADFERTKFNGTANFVGTKFHGTADFTLVTFDSSVSFEQVEFDSAANFVKTKFKDRSDFGFVTFDTSVSFRSAEFGSMADFWGTKFKGRADFREARFGGDVMFSYATLPDILDFRYIKDIRKEIDFTFSLPPHSKGKCHIALAGADIGKIKLSGALFMLCFPQDTTFGTSSAGKDSIERIDSTSYDGQLSVYESVLKKLKDDGLMESYKILDIEYRRFKYKHGGFFDRYILNTFQHLWWNYGYSKEFVFLWAIGLWVLFSLVNLIIYPKLSENVYEIKFLQKGIRYWLQVVTYTAIVFFGLKMDVANFKECVVRKHPWLFVYLMFVYVSGLVCLGFIVNIIFTR